MVLGSNTSLGFLPNQVLNELLDACLELWIDLWRGLHGFRALIALFLFLGLRAVALRSVILGVLGPVFLLGGYFLPFAGEAENAGLDAVLLGPVIRLVARPVVLLDLVDLLHVDLHLAYLSDFDLHHLVVA